MPSSTNFMTATPANKVLLFLGTCAILALMLNAPLLLKGISIERFNIYEIGDAPRRISLAGEVHVVGDTPPARSFGRPGFLLPRCARILGGASGSERTR